MNRALYPAPYFSFVTTENFFVKLFYLRFQLKLFFARLFVSMTCLETVFAQQRRKVKRRGGIPQLT